MFKAARAKFSLGMKIIRYDFMYENDKILTFLQYKKWKKLNGFNPGSNLRLSTKRNEQPSTAQRNRLCMGLENRLMILHLTYDHPNGFTYLQLGRDVINLFFI